MKEEKLSDFQKSFLARGGMKMFTEKEFEEHLENAKDEIMGMAIDAAKQAVLIERELCAKVVDEMKAGLENTPDMPLSVGVALEKCAENIRNRTKKKDQA